MRVSLRIASRAPLNNPITLPSIPDPFQVLPISTEDLTCLPTTTDNYSTPRLNGYVSAYPAYRFKPLSPFEDRFRKLSFDSTIVLSLPPSRPDTSPHFSIPIGLQTTLLGRSLRRSPPKSVKVILRSGVSHLLDPILVLFISSLDSKVV